MAMRVKFFARENLDYLDEAVNRWLSLMDGKIEVIGHAFTTTESSAGQQTLYLISIMYKEL